MTGNAVIIMAAGKGTRMKSATPKVLHKIAGKSMLGHVADVTACLDPELLVLVTGPESGDLTGEVVAIPSHKIVTAQQTERLGTGHAVMQAMPALQECPADTVIVLAGDTPLLTAEALDRLVSVKQETDADLVVLAFDAANPFGYGRMVIENGGLSRIVEEKDASEAEKAISLCNSGIMAFDRQMLAGWLDRLSNDNAQGEYYLTDVIALAVSDGKTVSVAGTDEDMVQGVNSRAQLAACETVFQNRMRQQVLDNAVTMEAPETVYFSADTIIAEDVYIEPNVVFAPGVTVESGARIRAFSHLEGCHVGPDAVVGPYARLRPGSNLAAGSKIGNFVELKNADIAEGAKVNHLSYVGDAVVGAAANVGAGTITCNYDGFNKSQTVIGAGAFIGSNTALVAPIKIGENAMVAAGSTITKDVAADALGLTRAPQKSLDGMAASLRKKYKAKKESK